ncbi:MAG TPA: WD40 repeat domain-containing protein [Gemmataceae bacterium]|jgi:WD40 repeat protein|nr:WD40 repeat domain-containing protein [Gemmataceae bacterium]
MKQNIFNLRLVTVAASLAWLQSAPSQAQDVNRQSGKFSIDGQVTTVALCSKYEYVAFGLKSGALSIFAVKERKPVYANAWKGHDKAVTCLVFSADDKQVVSGGMDGQLKVWDTVKSAEHAVTKELATKAQPSQKIKAHTGGVYGVAFSPDGKRLASAGADGFIKVWNTTNGELLFSFPAAHKGGARAVAFSPDGQSLVSGGMDKTVRIWEAKAGGKTTKTLDHPAPVYTVAVNADGSRIASGTGANNEQAHVMLWDWETGKQITDFKGHTDIVTGVEFHPTEERLISCSKDTTIRVWDLQKNEELYMDKHRDPVTSLSIAGDGKYFATASAEIIFLWQGVPMK